jgi:shikimate dehydrogenase
VTDVPTVPTDRTRLGVVGWPVAHSRSPAMHNAALVAVGLAQWRYSLLPVPPELVDETLRALPAAGFGGVNVTIPHKAAALAVADTASSRARAIGAANTLVFEDAAIAADNTDAPALTTTLAALGGPAARSALVLGAGGSARAAVWALRDAGVADVCVWNRTPERADALAVAFGARAVTQPAPADVLVNCTSLGLDGGDPFQDPSGFPLERADLRGYRVVVDYVYAGGGAGGSRLIDAAREYGVATVDGLELLVAQGALSFEQFTGRAAPYAVMRAAARAVD